ncbi:MAG: thiolase family protein, partial [Cyanobacteria bacterium HKST-UBA06]|nr:thiolase family protein [Cyanobacteria bacterium HKST-UBA06]
GKVCGSGMKSLLLARLEIMAGEADCVVAGGMENMSQAPFLLKGAREGLRLGHQQLLDSMVFDGLWDPYENIHMGNCAEQCVEKYNFSREDQDAYAIESYKRALAAQAAGDFAEEIVPVPVAQRKGDPLMVDTDEEPQRTVLDKIPSLRPAFDKNGTITAANASSINDGAAALVVASQKLVQENALKPLAKIVATATFSQTPMWFTTAPVEAIKAVVDKAGLGLGDIDAFEINEAFAAVPMAAMADLKLDHAKVNCRGSGVSLGHPIGASGARIVVTLAHLLKQKNLQYGLATLCIGGGEATAVILENVAS